MGIGTTNPSAKLHLPAGGTAPGSAPLKLTSSLSLLTTPEEGAIEYFNNSRLFFTRWFYGVQRNEIAQIAGTATILQNRTVFANASGYLTSDANFWLWDGTHAKLYQGITNGSGWLQIGNPSNTSDAIELGIQSSVSTGGGIAFSEGSNKAFIRKMGSGSGANLINPALNIPENSYLRIENPNGGIFLKGPNVILGTGGATTDVAVRLTTAGMLIGNNTNMANGPNAKLDVNGAVRMPTITTGAIGRTVRVSTDPLTAGQLVQDVSTQDVKSNITDIQFDRDTFFMLQPRDFIWKPAFGSTADVGLIAEEVATINPLLAIYDYKRFYDDSGNLLMDSLGNPILDSTQIVPQAVDYSRLTTYMLAVLKDHQDSIKEHSSQKDSIQALKAKINDMEAILTTCCNSNDSNSLGRMANKNNEDNTKTQKWIDPNTSLLTST